MLAHQIEEQLGSYLHSFIVVGLALNASVKGHDFRELVIFTQG
jgi:hypothetical protein